MPAASPLRPISLLRTEDQWLRCAHRGTSLDADPSGVGAVVELSSRSTTKESHEPAPLLGAGLAFDRGCRLYRSFPAAGRVARALWDAEEGTVDDASWRDVIRAARELLGDFEPAEPPAPLREPRGLAVDSGDRLFVAETGADRILVYDLFSERLLRRLALPGARPTDLAARGANVYAVLAGEKRVVRLTARTGPFPVALPPAISDPSRVAVAPDGRLAVLDQAATAAAAVHVPRGALPGRVLRVPFATDVEWESDEILVVARRPGADFLRFSMRAGGSFAERPLRARGYDGLGIVRVPHAGRIGYGTAKGFRLAVLARLVYERRGRVTTYRLDSGEFQTVWGRLFLDACIPHGTAVRVHTAVADEVEEGDLPLAWAPPENVEISTVVIRRPDLTPPLPPASLAPAEGEELHPIHRRESGRERPFGEPLPGAPGDGFATYEAPVETSLTVPAGRYLWVTLELLGDTKATPRVRSLRAEHPTHDYLRRLPKTYSRDEGAASFLRRYLALPEGFLGELEAKSAERHALLLPKSAPPEALPWLASFLGLVLDERFANAPGGRDARRLAIAQAHWLFRFRGTVAGLKRFIEIYTGTPVVIVERFRLRGLGAAVLGDTGTAITTSVLGGGFRVGGAVGEETPTPVGGSLDDAFQTHAHRFAVLVPAPLSAEELDVVRRILEVHRPAHTLFDLCTVDAGMRLGLGLHVGLSSIVGATGGFDTLRLGVTTLGRDAILGRPEAGGALGSARLGEDSRAG